MTETPDRLRLAGELGSWQVTLTGGAIASVAAHSYSRRGNEYVFSVLMEGTPRFEIDVASFPASIVDRVRGG